MLINLGAVLGRAAYVRERAGLNELDPPYSTRHICETLFPSIGVQGDDDLPAGVTEMALAEQARAGVRRVILYSRNVDHSMQRVSIMHGLHHHLVDLKFSYGIRECNLAARRLEVDSRAITPEELEADHFAGEVLAPFHQLDRYAPADPFTKDPARRRVVADEIDHLASRYNVPRWFMLWRLYDLTKLRASNFHTG
jgi:Zn-dependent peptidase ImmA (M78 family)